MFSGIVEEVGRIASARRRDRLLALDVEWKEAGRGVKVGDSVAINGVCLTVTANQARRFSFDIIPETLAKTNLGMLPIGAAINIERSLRLGDRVGGHFVLGHVDGLAEIRRRGDDGKSTLLEIEPPPSVHQLFVPKGFVALNGVSLTVVEVSERSFTVALIPQTKRVTNLGSVEVGDLLNIEVDYLAKLARFRRQVIPARETSTCLPSPYGNFTLISYQNGLDTPHLVLRRPWKGLPLVRIQSSCITAEAFRSLRCDCADQLDASLALIGKEGGLLIYLHDEGRGIGLRAKLRAYALQDLGFDTVAANEILGFPPEARTFEDAITILQDLGVRTVRLLTNNPRKVESLRGGGIEVLERIPLPPKLRPENRTYLRAKRDILGHLLEELE